MKSKNILGAAAVIAALNAGCNTQTPIGYAPQAAQPERPLISENIHERAVQVCELIEPSTPVDNDPSTFSLPELCAIRRGWMSYDSIGNGNGSLNEISNNEITHNIFLDVPFGEIDYAIATGKLFSEKEMAKWSRLAEDGKTRFLCSIPINNDQFNAINTGELCVFRNALKRKIKNTNDEKYSIIAVGAFGNYMKGRMESMDAKTSEELDVLDKQLKVLSGIELELNHAIAAGVPISNQRLAELKAQAGL